MRKLTTVLMCLALLLSSMPAFAEPDPGRSHAGEAGASGWTAPTVPLVRSHGTSDVAEATVPTPAQPVLFTAARLMQEGPVATLPGDVQRSLPIDRARGQARRQMSGGGGKTAAVVGLLGTLAGLAGTYYLVKTLRDDSKGDETR